MRREGAAAWSGGRLHATDKVNAMTYFSALFGAAFEAALLGKMINLLSAAGGILIVFSAVMLYVESGQRPQIALKGIAVKNVKKYQLQ